MKISRTDLPGVVLVEPKLFRDDRGYFTELFSQERYAAEQLPDRYPQDNLSCSSKHVLRGLHFQQPNAQGKLVTVLKGKIFDVAVDIRVGSPTFGKWISEELSGEDHRQLYIPVGFAHGFCVLSEQALVLYKTTEKYHPEYEHTLVWNDPALGIDWPVSHPVVSRKDGEGKRLADFPTTSLPAYQR